MLGYKIRRHGRRRNPLKTQYFSWMARGMYTAARDGVNRNERFKREAKIDCGTVSSARYFSPGAGRKYTDFLDRIVLRLTQEN
jgi:hypothetical protein